MISPEHGLLPTEGLLTGYLNDWLRRENLRLHGPNTSILTDLEASRRASELPFEHWGNTNARKASQHLDRLRLRVNDIGKVNGDHEYVGRATSDVLKLLAGFRVRRFMVQARGAQDFRERLLDQSLDVSTSVSIGFAEYNGESTLPEVHRSYQDDAERVLKGYSQRAEGGRFWGRETSPLVTLTEEGEQATVRMGLAVIQYAAVIYEDLAKVPVRAPETDAGPTVLEYPFAT